MRQTGRLPMSLLLSENQAGLLESAVRTTNFALLLMPPLRWALVRVLPEESDKAARHPISEQSCDYAHLWGWIRHQEIFGIGKASFHLALPHRHLEGQSKGPLQSSRLRGELMGNAPKA